MMSSNTSKLTLVHIGLLTGVILGLWAFVSGLVEGLAGYVDPATFNADQALGPMPGLFATALSYALVFTWYANRTQLSGYRLAAVVFIVLFGVTFFMTQIETLYFLDSIQMPYVLIFGQVLAGVFVGTGAGLLSSRYKKKLDAGASDARSGFNSLPLGDMLRRFTILSIVYTLFYYFFGYFIAWQFPALREYYSGSTALTPFIPHMLGQVTGEPQLIVFQVFRGYLWAGIAYMAAMNLPKAKAWERMVIVGLCMAIGASFPLLLPQDFMPAPVRLGHFFELFIENFLFGVVAAYLFLKDWKPVVESPTGQTSTTAFPGKAEA
jgi:hypothetical protein